MLKFLTWHVAQDSSDKLFTKKDSRISSAAISAKRCSRLLTIRISTSLLINSSLDRKISLEPSQFHINKNSIS